jgi:hypothetical protein
MKYAAKLISDLLFVSACLLFGLSEYIEDKTK